MLNITTICKKYKKLPSAFLDNPRIMRHPDFKKVQKSKGYGGCTQLPPSLAPEFYLWLSPQTRLQIMSGVIWNEVKH